MLKTKGENNMNGNIQNNPNRGLAPVDFGATLLHALLSFLPFAAVFYFFIPLQSYTHWAFIVYYRLVWILPLTGLIHLIIRADTWRDRWRIIGVGVWVSVVVVTVLTLAWGIYG